MAIELGAGYISILPDTSKLTSGIKEALLGSQSDAKESGNKMGSELSQGMAKGAKESAKAIKTALQDGTKTASTEGKQAGNRFSQSFGSAMSSIKKGFKDTFNSAERDAKASGEKIKRSLSQSAPKEKGDGLGVGIGLAGAGLAAGGLALFKFASDSIAAGQDSILVGKQTEAVLKSTGGQANLTASQIGDLATALSNATGIDDEYIQSGENMLLTFTNVKNVAGKNNDVFNQATKSALDMSVAMGTDLKSASILVGKALNDPVQGVSALTRVGVTFTKQQKDQIAAMQKVGNTAGAQKIVIRELNKEFGGSAEKQATPMKKLQVAIGNIQEAVGQKLLPIMNKFAQWVLGTGLPTLSKFGDWFNRNIMPKVKVFTNFIKTDILPRLATLTSWIKDRLQPPLKALGDWMGRNGTTVKAFAITIGILATAIGIWTGVQWLLNSALLASPITWIVLGIGALVGSIVYAWTHFETFRKVVLAVWSGIKTAISVAWNSVIKPVFKALSAFVTGVLGPVVVWYYNNIIKRYFNLIGAVVKGVWDRFIHPMFQVFAWTIQNVVAPVLSWLYSNIIKPVFGAIGEYFSDVWTKTIKPVFSALGSFIQDTVVPAFQKGVGVLGTIWNGIKSAFLAPINFVIDVVYNKGIRKLINSLPGVTKLSEMALLGGGDSSGPSGGGTPNQKNGGRYAGYADGGAVFGAGSATSDSIPAWLSNGEHVFTASEVKAAGGHGVMYAFRQWLLKKGMGKTFDPPAFKDGGALTGDQIARAQAFAKSQVGDPYVWGGVGPNGFDCSGFMSAITNVILGRNPYSRVGATASFPWAGFQPGPGQFTIGSTNNYGGSGIGHMAGTLAGMNVESRGGQGVVIGKNARGFNDKGFNTVAHLGNSDTGGVLGAVVDVIKNLKGWISELSHMGGFGGLVSQMVSSVVHKVADFAKSKASFGIFDNGGILEPGAIAYNASSKPEAVFNHRQFAQYAADKSGRSGRMEMVGRIENWEDGTVYFREIAGQEYDDAVNYRRK